MCKKSPVFLRTKGVNFDPFTETVARRGLRPSRYAIVPGMDRCVIGRDPLHPRLSFVLWGQKAFKCINDEVA